MKNPLQKIPSYMRFHESKGIQKVERDLLQTPVYHTSSAEDALHTK